MASGDLQAARCYFDENLTISRQLAQDDPHSTQKKRDIAASTFKIAGLLAQQKQWADALPFAEECLGITERLASIDPTNVTWKNDVAFSRRLVADMRQQLGLA